MNLRPRVRHVEQQIENDFDFKSERIQILRDLILSVIVKGLSSVNRRIHYSARGQLTEEQSSFLKNIFGVSARPAQNEDLLDRLRIVRANFHNALDYSKIQEGSFRIAVKRTRQVSYRKYENGQLKTIKLRPTSYFLIYFRRQDDKLDFKTF